MAEKILVIDDEETTVHLISILLERRGYEVIKAFRAEDGLRKAYRSHPDLVLLDIMMPDMDGWEVCRRLRELSDVPIVFLTARSEIRDVVRGLEMGADDYVVKPCAGTSAALTDACRIRGTGLQRWRFPRKLPEPRSQSPQQNDPPDAERVQFAWRAGSQCWPRDYSHRPCKRGVGARIRRRD